MIKLITALSLITLLSACAGPPTGSQEGTVLEQLSATWIEALNAGDIDTLVGLYADNARVLPPNAELASGGDAVRAAFGAMIDAGLNGTLTPIETRIAGDIGYHVGIYRLAADGELVDRGKYIETWRLIDGQWRITNDIFNSDLPAAELEPARTDLVITHEVADPAHWLAAWQGPRNRHEMFSRHGAPHVQVFQNTDNPNITGLLINVSDMERLQTFLSSTEGNDAAIEDGVRMDTLTVFVPMH